MSRYNSTGSLRPESPRTVLAGDAELRALRERVTDLEDQLRFVTLERDEAFATINAIRALLCGEPARLAPNDVYVSPGSKENACPVCEGEGILWVHDFRMDCKRCDGTGRQTKR
jgi:hypothetical protein